VERVTREGVGIADGGADGECSHLLSISATTKSSQMIRDRLTHSKGYTAMGNMSKPIENAASRLEVWAPRCDVSA
jgi:hypothetical protein